MDAGVEDEADTRVEAPTKTTKTLNSNRASPPSPPITPCKTSSSRWVSNSSLPTVCASNTSVDGSFDATRNEITRATIAIFAQNAQPDASKLTHRHARRRRTIRRAKKFVLRGSKYTLPAPKGRRARKLIFTRGSTPPACVTKKQVGQASSPPVRTNPTPTPSISPVKRRRTRSAAETFVAIPTSVVTSPLTDAESNAGSRAAGPTRVFKNGSHRAFIHSFVTRARHSRRRRPCLPTKTTTGTVTTSSCPRAIRPIDAAAVHRICSDRWSTSPRASKNSSRTRSMPKRRTWRYTPERSRHRRR